MTRATQSSVASSLWDPTCHVLRNAGRDLNRGARSWMHKAKGVGVEELPRDPEPRPVAGRTPAVHRVARRRMAQRGQVDADLVGPAGLERDINQCAWECRAFWVEGSGLWAFGFCPQPPTLNPEPLQDTVMGDRLPAADMPDRHLLAALRMAAERRVDRAGIEREQSLHDGEVAAVDGPRLHLPGKRGPGRLGLGDQEQAGGVFVEPVDNPCPSDKGFGVRGSGFGALTPRPPPRTPHTLLLHVPPQP